ncbi:MAG: hypothetical protein QOF04_1449 [Solirubrobacteraceae bacterium]|nr:hypothetical protein [Solirubrobacteraceae bacterium]
MDLESLGARDGRGGGREHARRGPDPHLAHAPAEVPRPELGGEPRRAAGRQRVVGAADLVAEGGGALAQRGAVAFEPTETGVPSTKGTLTA